MDGDVWKAKKQKGTSVVLYILVKKKTDESSCKKRAAQKCITVRFYMKKDVDIRLQFNENVSKVLVWRGKVRCKQGAGQGCPVTPFSSIPPPLPLATSLHHNPFHRHVARTIPMRHTNPRPVHYLRHQHHPLTKPSFTRQVSFHIHVSIFHWSLHHSCLEIHFTALSHFT